MFFLVAGAIPLTAATFFTYQAEGAATIAQHASVTKPQAPQTNLAQASEVKRSGRRVALLIGNMDYNARVGPLKIPVHDIKELDDLGLTLVPASDFPESQSKEGVAISSVDPSAKAAELGIKSGDIITGVDSEPVSTVEDVISVIRKAREKGRKIVLFQIHGHDPRQRFVALPVVPKALAKDIEGAGKDCLFPDLPPDHALYEFYDKVKKLRGCK